jgi:hypothetical protein
MVASYEIKVSGPNLVRFLYLDETGISFDAPRVSVAGVIVHGDTQYPKIRERFDALIEENIPEDDRHNFTFHATDLYQGSDYYRRHRSEWPPERRLRVFNEIVKIIEDFVLPVVLESHDRTTIEAIVPNTDRQDHTNFVQALGILGCLLKADAWLAKFSPNELAVVVHEDGTKAKSAIQSIIRNLRSDNFWKDGITHYVPELNPDVIRTPLKRIVDTVHFVGRADSPTLQLADFCAFTFGRSLKGLEVPEDSLKIIKSHMWVPHIHAGSEAVATDAETTSAL